VRPGSTSHIAIFGFGLGSGTAPSRIVGEAATLVDKVRRAEDSASVSSLQMPRVSSRVRHFDMNPVALLPPCLRVLKPRLNDGHHTDELDHL
jgi:hypothetical protein